ncbi:MAG: hypothetical protein EBU08_22310, partial [Micrococcales bacterium]|nr:hypothetical protein [Micrococcales bacterium]
MPILGTQASQNTKSFLGLAVDYLVVAGGGGGGYAAGGGGAGGYRTSTGSNQLNIAFNTSFTVTVGAGGVGGVGDSGVTSTQSTNGNNSIFSTITSTGGGKGADYDTAGNTGT